MAKKWRKLSNTVRKKSHTLEKNWLRNPLVVSALYHKKSDTEFLLSGFGLPSLPSFLSHRPNFLFLQAENCYEKENDKLEADLEVSIFCVLNGMLCSSGLESGPDAVQEG
nr:hypothetical protein Iba_chr04eCG12930 [Ipomoea batatas]